MRFATILWFAGLAMGLVSVALTKDVDWMFGAGMAMIVIAIVLSLRAEG